MISAALEDVPRAQFNYNFDYEHQLISRLESEDQSSAHSVRLMPACCAPEDPSLCLQSCLLLKLSLLAKLTRNIPEAMLKSFENWFARL